MLDIKDISGLKVGFIGSMNAMPMALALKLKELGFNVKYIVESSEDKMLMRPECHYKNISYPYPEWIKEMLISKLLYIFYPLFPGLFLRKIVKEMSDRDLIFFNDYGFQISKYFSKSTVKFGMFSGSDLDILPDPENLWRQLKLFKFKTYAECLLGLIRAHNQRQGIKECHILSYFPRGFNKNADELMDDLMYGLSYKDVRKYGSTNYREINVHYSKPNKGNKFVILSPVRFMIDHDSIEYKGNDLIIKAVGKLYEDNKNIELHLFEKGPEEDIARAKIMCEEYGLVDIVVWHKELPLEKLLELYQESDVVIDQVGSHWPGAISFYGLHMGKPVIANINQNIHEHFWDEESPFLVASDIQSIHEKLNLCLSYEYRENIGKRSYNFARKNINIDIYVEKYLAAIRDVIGNFDKYRRE